MPRNARIEGYKADLGRLAGKKARLIDAIADGVPACEIKDELARIAARREELEGLLNGTEEAPVRMHPHMAERYRSEVNALVTALNDPPHSAEAAALLRSLIEKIVLTPNPTNTALTIDLAGILSMATGKDQRAAVGDLEVTTVKLVAGEGLEPPTRGL